MSACLLLWESVSRIAYILSFPSLTTDSSLIFSFFFKALYILGLKIFVSLLAALGLWCCTQALSSWGEQGLLCVVGLLVAVASLVAGHRL